MKSGDGAKKQLPVVLPPVPDELLSSWIARHAAFYGVSLRAMLRHADPDARSRRAADAHLTQEQEEQLAHIFRREVLDIRRMTFANISNSARRLVAAKPIQACSACATKNKSADANAAILRSWLQAWRITCPVCGYQMSVVGQGSATNSGESLPSLASSEEALGGERLLDDYAERGAQTWASPIDLLRLLLIRRDPKPIDPDHWIETPKVLDLVVPGFDRQAETAGTPIPSGDRPILPLALRPALLARIAIVERSGPEIIAKLHARTIGASHVHFGTIAARILAPEPSTS